jgi:hypothetical protein
MGGEGGVLFPGTATSTGAMTTGSGTGGSKPVCDGSPTTGPFQWVQSSFDDGGQYALAVATDGNGNVLITGEYSAMTTLTFGGKKGPADTHQTAFVAKFGSDGTPLWITPLPTVAPFPSNSPLYSTGRAIATDSQGNVYIAGDFAGTLNLGPNVITSQGNFFADAFLAKLDPMGAPLWGVRLGDDTATTGPSMGGNQTPRAIAVHKAAIGDQVALVGDFQTTLDLHNGTVLQGASPMSSTPRGFLAVFFGSTGATRFGFALGDGSVAQSARGVAFDGNGDLLIAGNTTGPIAFPGGPMISPAGTQAAFVAKIKGDGSAATWAKLYGAGTASGEGVATDPAGNVFVTGDHQGAIDFGGGPLDNVGGSNVFVAKLDAAGAHIWSHTYGDGLAQHAHGIAADAMGRAFVAGDFQGQLDFGGGALTSAGNDIFLARLDTHGCQVWAKSFGDPALQKATGIVLDPMGNPVITGSFTGTVNFGAMAVPTKGDDVLVAKFGP